MFHKNLQAVRNKTNKEHSHQESLNNSFKVLTGGGSWLSHLSHLTRALVVYNSDLQGAALVIMTYMEDKEMNFDKNLLVKNLVKINNENIMDIPTINTMIKDVMQ